MKHPFLILALMVMMLASSLAVGSTNQLQTPLNTDKHIRARITNAQRQALEAYNDDVFLEFDQQLVPTFLMGELSARNSDDPVADARVALDLHGKAFRRGSDDDFSFRVAARHLRVRGGRVIL